jgi:hypothetical protein
MAQGKRVEPEFYIVRASWDTGYEDFDYGTLDAAMNRRQIEVKKIVDGTPLAHEEAEKFVVIYAVTRLEL